MASNQPSLEQTLALLRYHLNNHDIVEMPRIELRNFRDGMRLLHTLNRMNVYGLGLTRDTARRETGFKFMGFWFWWPERDYYGATSPGPGHDVQHGPQEAAYEEAASGVPELASPPLLLLPPADNE